MNENDIERLHNIYISETGMGIPLRPDRRKAWAKWEAEGFSEEDLIAVIARIKRKSYRWDYLRFDNLIEKIGWFEQELALVMLEKKHPARSELPTRAEILKLAERKREKAEAIREEHAFDTPMGYEWQDKSGKKQEYFRLLLEREELMKLWENSVEEQLAAHKRKA